MSATDGMDLAGAVPQDDLEALRRLIQGITLAQGNIFIKELLRQKKIPLGATKAEFEKHMLAAIDNGTLQRADLEAWLDDVEGWGDQHIYLYNIPRAITSDALWRDPEHVHNRVVQANLGDVWEAPTSLRFPEEPELTCITFADSVLRLVLHEGSPGWVPEPGRNFEEIIDGDRYQFRAFRERARRVVTRFEMRLNVRLAALFIPVRINTPEHKAAIELVEATVSRLLPFDVIRKKQIVITEVIKNLDQANYAPAPNRRPDVVTQSTRLTSGGAYVEFTSSSEDHGYAESPSIRQVRRTIRQQHLPEFSGSNGVLKFHRTDTNQLSREVKVQLYGTDRRIRIWRRLTASDVWNILSIIARHQ